MKGLNHDYYQVLYLMYFEDLDTEGIAVVMHKSKRQIGDLIYRAKKSLKSILEKAGFHYEDFKLEGYNPHPHIAGVVSV